MIEETLVKHKHNFFASIGDALKEDSIFDRFGNFTAAGKFDYWYEINDLIEDFEKDDSQYKPRPGASKIPATAGSMLNSNANNTQYYRMPPPPPRPRTQVYFHQPNGIPHYWQKK